MRKILVASAVLLLSVCAFAQTGTNQSGTSQASSQTSPPQPAKPAQEPQKPTTVITTTVVLVPVTVKDTKGDLVPNLEKSDFRVFQDGKEQRIANFWDEAFPVSAVVLLDDDLPTNESQKVQQSLDSIAAGFSAADEVALVRFDEFPKTVLDFTTSNDALFAKLKEIRTNPKEALDSRVAGSPSFPMTSPPRLNGQTLGGAADIPILGTSNNGVTKHIDDAVHYAAEMLRPRGHDRRKIIFVISDGTNDRHNQWSFNNTLELLLSANVSVYGISVSSVADVLALRGRGRLGQYAVPTGGDVVSASSPQEMEPLYSKLTEEARNEYTLGFQPTRTIGRGNCHSLEVRVERPNLSVHAREGYCAPFPR
jgi:VWFA-related protein